MKTRQLNGAARGITTLALIAALGACGGGGGSDEGDGSSYNTQAAWTALNTQARTLNLTGTYQNVPLSMQLVFGAAAPASVSLSSNTTRAQPLTTHLTIAGEMTSFSVFQWLDADSRVWGSSDTLPPDSTDACEVATSSQLPPTAATIGQSGLLVQGVSKTCTAGGTELGTYTTHWSLESINGAPWFCTTTASTVSGTTSTGKNCHGVSPSGTLSSNTRVSITSVVDGQTIELLFTGK